MSAYKKDMVKEASLFMCLALLTAVALVQTGFAEPWFSSSRYGYWAGDVDSWDRDSSVHSHSGYVPGYAVVGPRPLVYGGDPEACLAFDAISDVVVPPNSTECYLQSIDVFCNMTSVSTVQLDYDGKDFYMAAVWEIKETVWLVNANVTNIRHYVNGFRMTSMILCVTTNTGSEAFIKEILAFAGEENIANLKAYVAPVVEDIADPFEVAEQIATHAAEANIANVTIYIHGVNLTDSWDISCDILAEYDGTIDGKGEPRASWVSIGHQEPDSPGELYVVGNWTDFTANIKGLGVFTGKVTNHVVKNEEPTVPKINVKVDINHDGKINILDVAVVARVFGCTKDTRSYNPLVDINSDYIINILDLSAVARDRKSVV